MKCTPTSDMSSYFQMKCSDSDIPPMQNCHWQQINYCPIYVCNKSPFETVTELGQVFRWSVQLGQLVGWSAQIYPPHLKLSMTGDEVIADQCLQWDPIQNGHGIRSSFQMKCPTRLICQIKCTLRSDIPPKIRWHVYRRMSFSDEVFTFTCCIGHMSSFKQLM